VRDALDSVVQEIEFVNLHTTQDVRFVSAQAMYIIATAVFCNIFVCFDRTFRFPRAMLCVLYRHVFSWHEHGAWSKSSCSQTTHIYMRISIFMCVCLCVYIYASALNLFPRDEMCTKMTECTVWSCASVYTDSGICTQYAFVWQGIFTEYTCTWQGICTWYTCT
jgi:hypothetical protein